MRKFSFALSTLFSCMLLAATMTVATPAFAGEGGEGHAKPKAEKKAEGEKAEKKKGKDKGGSVDVSAGPENSFYLKMDPMIMPVLGKDNVQETVSMIVALQITDEKNITQVSHLVPKIKDAYMTALYGNLNKAAYRNGQFLDVNKVKTKLLSVTGNFADRKIIQDVLIQGVSQRRFN